MATAIKEKKKKSKADWDDGTTDAFIKICVNETLAANWPNGQFNKTGWKNLISKFYSMTNREYEQKQLKNKWDILKKDWQLCTNLMRNEIVLGWDLVKQTITTSDEWWERKLKMQISNLFILQCNRKWF